MQKPEDAQDWYQETTEVLGGKHAFRDSSQLSAVYKAHRLSEPFGRALLVEL
jgi:hypothetical protein